MAAHDAELRRLAARAGGAAKNGLPDSDTRRAELATTRLERHIRRIVNDAPPLSDSQRDRIAALLRPGTAGTEEDRAKLESSAAAAEAALAAFTDAPEPPEAEPARRGGWLRRPPVP